MASSGELVIEPGIENDREEIATYRWSGSQKRILLVHGWGGRAVQFFGLIPSLVESGFEVIGFDAPAHGRSTGEFASGPAFAKAACEVAARFGAPDAIVCHSLGALATTIALSTGLQAERIVMLAPLALIEPSLEEFAQAQKLSTAQKRFFYDDFYAKYANEILQVPAAAPKFQNRCLIIHDPEDPDVPVAHGRLIASVWKGAILQERPGVGHWRILRAHEVIEDILKFVRTQ